MRTHRSPLGFLFPLFALAMAAALPRAQAQTTLTASPFQMGFYSQRGQPNSGLIVQGLNVSGITATVNVSTVVDTPLNVNWLFVTSTVLNPADGATRRVDVQVIPSGLQPGTYTGRVRLQPQGAAELVVPVSVVVSDLKMLVPSPATVEFAVSRNAPIPANIALQMTSTSSAITASITVSSVPGNLFEVLDPAVTDTPATIPVRLRTTDLAVGTYEGSITFTSSGTGNPTLVVPVRVSILEEARAIVSPTSLSFDYQVSTTVPAAKIVSVTSSGGAIPFTVEAAVGAGTSVNWITVNPTSAATPQNVSVGLQNLAGLSAGTYQATVTIRPSGRAAITVPVSLRVFTDPLLIPTPAQLFFTFQQGGTTPPKQTLVLSNAGNPVAINVTSAAATGGWLSATPAAASTPALVQVTVTPGSLAPGTYDGNVEVRGSIGNSPLQIPVRMVITASTVPQLRVSQNQLNFAIQNSPGSATSQSQTLNVTSTGAVTAFTAAADGGTGWLSVSPSGNQNTAGTVTVTVAPGSLPPGTYTAAVRLSTTDLSAVPISVPVRMVVSTQPLLTVTPAALSFSFAGSTAPPRQSVGVGSTGNGIPYSATSSVSSGGSWLVTAQTGASTPSAIDVAAIPQGTDGLGLITLIASGVDNSPLYVPVTLTNTAVSQLTLTPAQLSFVLNLGGTAPAAQNVDIGVGQGALSNYRITGIQYLNGNGWIRLNKTAGIAPDRLEVSIDPASLTTVGSYAATINIESGVGTGSIPVFLEVRRNLPTFAVSQESLTFNFTPGGSTPATQQVTITSSGDPLSFTAEARTSTGSGWLQLAATSLTTPSTLTISVVPGTLPAGTYLGSIVLTSSAAGNSPRSINVTFNVAAVAAPSLSTFINAASAQPTAAVPGLIVSLGGTGIGPTQGVTAAPNGVGLFEKTLAGVRVLFEGIEAPILFANSTQINAIVPNGIAGRLSTRVQVEYNGVRSNSLDLRVADVSPGIFTANAQGFGQGAILNQDLTVNSVNNPAARDSIVVLYGTGDGVTNPPRVDGSIPGRSSSLKRPVQQVRARVGGVDAVVEYAGSAPLLVEGALQVNVRIPANITPGGAVPVELIVGGTASPLGVTLAVR